MPKPIPAPIFRRDVIIPGAREIQKANDEHVELARLRAAMEKARVHLEVAMMLSISEENHTIMGHVRAAWRELGGVE